MPGAQAVRQDEVGTSAVETLPQPMLAAINGGGIATIDRSLIGRTLVRESAVG